MKTVGIADLKAHLSEHLRSVKSGRSLTVLDRNAPVAQLVPMASSALEIRKATRRPSDLPKPPRASGKAASLTDSLAALLVDRQRR